MRETCQSGSEGGAAFIAPFLPLSCGGPGRAQREVGRAVLSPSSRARGACERRLAATESWVLADAPYQCACHAIDHGGLRTSRPTCGGSARAQREVGRAVLSPPSRARGACERRLAATESRVFADAQPGVTYLCVCHAIDHGGLRTIRPILRWACAHPARGREGCPQPSAESERSVRKTTGSNGARGAGRSAAGSALVRCEASRSSGVRDPGHLEPCSG